MALHGAAVLRWHDQAVEIAGGAFTGGTSLLPGPDGEAWVFDYKTAGWAGGGRAVTLTRLGGDLRLGDEERRTVDFHAGIWSAVWLCGRRFYLAGDGQTPSITLLQQLPGHHNALDLVGALVDLRDRGPMTSFRR